MAKLVTLEEWAEDTYTCPPSVATLRRWARNGNIYPPPERHGTRYQVEPNAIYIRPNKHCLKAPVNGMDIRRPRKGTLLEKLQNEQKAGKI
ncbi:excisionase [Enterobacter sp. E76]|nr:excisionase [Enterobacter sp. E76]